MNGFMKIKTLLLGLFFLGCVTKSNSQNLDSFEWTVYDTANHSLPSNMAMEVVFDKDGNAWVCTGSMNLSKFDGKKWTLIRKESETITGWLKEILILKDGTFLITGEPGKLNFYNPKTNKWRSQATPNIHQMWKVAMNDEGVILMGASNGSNRGLYQYLNGSFELITDTLEDVMGIDIASNGDALVGFRKGLYRYKIKSDGTYKGKPEKLSSLAFYNTIEDSTGTLWSAAYTRTHLFTLQKDSWTEHINLPQNIYYDYNGDWKYCIHNVAQTPDKKTIISTQFGAHIAVLEDTVWKTYSLPIGSEFDGIECIQWAPDGSLWVATWYHGVWVFSHKNNTKYPKTKGKPVVPKPKVQKKPEIWPNQQQPDPQQNQRIQKPRLIRD